MRVKQDIKNETKNELKDIDAVFKQNLVDRRDALATDDDLALATDLDRLLQLSIETGTAIGPETGPRTLEAVPLQGSGNDQDAVGRSGANEASVRHPVNNKGRRPAKTPPKKPKGGRKTLGGRA